MGKEGRKAESVDGREIKGLVDWWPQRGQGAGVVQAFEYTSKEKLWSEVWGHMNSGFWGREKACALSNQDREEGQWVEEVKNTEHKTQLWASWQPQQKGSTIHSCLRKRRQAISIGMEFTLNDRCNWGVKKLVSWASKHSSNEGKQDLKGQQLA